MNCLKITHRFARTLRFQSVQQSARTLFTAETLDLITYQKNRNDAMNNVESPHHFKWELQCYIQNDPEKDSAGLKNAIEVLAHLVQSDVDDIKLMKETVYAYGAMKDVTEKAKRSIGNLIMSTLHTINMPDAALELYNDPQLNEFFAGFKSTLVLLDLLYCNGKYDKIIEIDTANRQKLSSKRSNSSKFIDLLIFGACYKLNTPESFDYAHKLWTTVGQEPHFRRSVGFVAALALNQCQPAATIQTLQNVDEYFVTEQIKLMALADLGYSNETIDAISLWMTNEKLTKHKISKDVIERIQNHLKRNSTITGLQQYQAIYNEFIKDGRISNETLDKILDRPISSRIGFRGKRAEDVYNLSDLRNF